MIHSSSQQSGKLRRELAQFERERLARYQLDRLNQLLSEILPQNQFYAARLAGCPTRLASLDQLSELPTTSKHELEPGPDHFEPTNLTYPLERYVRYHETSGMRGHPLSVLDTADDWQWWIDTWQWVLDAAEITSADRALLAFSFGPFIGFWSAHDALVSRGALVISGGGTDTLGRLRRIASTDATALFCTPTYALHMAEVAREHHIDLAESPVRCIVVAGEPGGSVRATRQRMAAAWNATVIDHAGASEVGPWGFGDAAGDGLYVIESEFIAEFVAVGKQRPASEGELAELILTTLGRYGAPLIRYRTGDLVRPSWRREGPADFVFLEGGVLGRADDMMIVRGVNIFPSSVEQIVRSFAEIDEFRLVATKSGEMDQLVVEVEDRQNEPQRVAAALRAALGLSVEVRGVPLGSLPRFEGKANRFVDQRKRTFVDRRT